jgi:hypothetical protein
MSEHVVRPREMQILRRQVQDVRFAEYPETGSLAKNASTGAAGPVPGILIENAL